MINCPFCGGEIQTAAIKCKHCKGWLQNKPEQQTATTSQHQKHQSQRPTIGTALNTNITSTGSSMRVEPLSWSTFSLSSWKSWFVAFIIAALINAGAAMVAGTKPAKNILWTVAWFYLTIESWKYWGWKSLIPYPAYLLCAYILGSLLVTLEVDKMAVLLVWGVMNICGLVIFYKLLKKSAENN